MMVRKLPRCAACSVHVHADEQRCPFCGAALQVAGRPGARIVAAAALVGIATACSAYGPCPDCGSSESAWQSADGAANVDATDLLDGLSATADVVDLALDVSVADVAAGASATEAGASDAVDDVGSR